MLSKYIISVCSERIFWFIRNYFSITFQSIRNSSLSTNFKTTLKNPVEFVVWRKDHGQLFIDNSYYMYSLFPKPSLHPSEPHRSFSSQNIIKDDKIFIAKERRKWHCDSIMHILCRLDHFPAIGFHLLQCNNDDGCPLCLHYIPNITITTFIPEIHKWRSFLFSKGWSCHPSYFHQ